MQTIMEKLGEGDQDEFITSLAEEKIRQEGNKNGLKEQNDDLQSEKSDNISEFDDEGAYEGDVVKVNI